MAKVFISYAHEDFKIAKRIYNDLKYENVDAWIDREDLLPGENWSFSIQQAIKNSDYFLALLSSNSISKRGFFQKELRIALEILDEIPENSIFLIPVRIEKCNLHLQKLSDLHWIDLFTTYDENFKKLLKVLTRQAENSDEKLQTQNIKNEDEINTFQFRAECEYDVNKLYKIISPNVQRLNKKHFIIDTRQFKKAERAKIDGTAFAPLIDVDVEIETNLSLEELRNAMLQVEDGHVMIETVTLKS